MYCDNLTKSFKRYLESRDIKCVESFDGNTNFQSITESDIQNQVYNISEFHIKTLGYTGYMNKRLDNNIGKTVEQYKMYIKRLSKQINKLRENGINNEFEELLSEYGDIYLERANRCINTIYKNDYIKLILRSMKRTEMCLGNPYFSNLRKQKSLEIIDVDGCCYNMCEMDIASFLGKIKRKKIDVDFNNLTRDFCTLESLDKNSYMFILSIISYPYEFVKCCNRYREGTKKWTVEQYAEKLQKAIIADGDSLV